jgi:hypothetical protein
VVQRAERAAEEVLALARGAVPPFDGSLYGWRPEDGPALVDAALAGLPGA